MNNIEILEDYLKFIKKFDNNYALIPGLENLIQEYKELKEKVKELYSENLKLNSEIASSVYWLSTPTKDIEKQFIPKSKVKEKIEELQDEFEYLGEDNKRVNKMTIETLQELLEEGGK